MPALPNWEIDLHIHLDAIQSVSTDEKRAHAIEDAWDACMETISKDGRLEAQAAQEDMDEFREFVARQITVYKTQRDRLIDELFSSKDELEHLLADEVARRLRSLVPLADRVEREGESPFSTNGLLALLATPAPENSLCRDPDRERLLALRALRRRLKESGEFKRLMDCRNAYSAAVRARSLEPVLEAIDVRSSVWRHARWYAAGASITKWSDLPLSTRDEMQAVNRDDDDAFEVKLGAIRELVTLVRTKPDEARELLENVGSRGQKEVYLAAVELVGLKFEDPESTFRKDMSKHFEDRFERRIPRDLDDWMTFFDNEFKARHEFEPPDGAATENGTE